MSYTFAENIQSVLIDSVSAFQSDDSGSNLGVGYTGWDNAYRYARLNALDVFGSIFPATGDDQNTKAFGYGMWTWAYYIRIHVRFDVSADPSPDEVIANLSTSILAALSDGDNARTVAPGAYAKVVAANYLGEPENIEDVTYLTLEFLTSVKAQFER